jgi:hypothetical protein
MERLAPGLDGYSWEAALDPAWTARDDGATAL